MQQYPSIQTPPTNDYIIAFDKLDGSNIRVEWTRKSGFVKFGTKKRLLGHDDEPFCRAIPLIMQDYSEWLDLIFRKQRWNKATAFFELHGPNSQFGWHDPDERQQVTLIDVHVYKHGIIDPCKFIKLFANLGIPDVVFRGKVSKEFIETVRHGEVPGMGPEGVMCKTAFNRKLGRPYMFKLKRQSWYDRLQEWCDQNRDDTENAYEELK